MRFTIEPADSTKYITLAMAKKHLRLDHDLEDDLIQDYIDAAIDEVEQHCSVTFGKRAFAIDLEQFTHKIELPFYQVRSITQISYTDLEGNTVIMPEADYKIVSYTASRENRIILLNGVPNVQPDSTITITGQVGTDKVPASVKQAVKLLIGKHDTYREDHNAGVVRAVNKLLRPYKY